MNLFKIWSKSGAAITLKGLGISDAEAHKIINNAPDSFINSIRKITSSLSRKQKKHNISVGLYYIFSRVNATIPPLD